jgi:hypothetical protein
MIRSLDPGQHLVALRTVRSRFYSPKGSQQPAHDPLAVGRRSLLGRFDVAELRAAR